MGRVGPSTTKPFTAPYLRAFFSLFPTCFRAGSARTSRAVQLSPERLLGSLFANSDDQPNFLNYIELVAELPYIIPS